MHYFGRVCVTIGFMTILLAIFVTVTKITVFDLKQEQEQQLELPSSSSFVSLFNASDKTTTAEEKKEEEFLFQRDHQSEERTQQQQQHRHDHDLLPLPRKYAAAPFPYVTTTTTTTNSGDREDDALQQDHEAQEEATTTTKTLYVHVVPHTHDDVGWLKTVDEYYYGWNNTIQNVSVEEIITSVIESLLENSARTFTYVEMKFFTMWYYQQPPHVQRDVHYLIHTTQQLSFVNGGWCMHDEGTTHYMGMIDQTTLGHDFLHHELKYFPSVGWQLDAFGHSSIQQSLMTHKVGFNALYFGRIDYQDLEFRQTTQQCEGLWNTRTTTPTTPANTSTAPATKTNTLNTINVDDSNTRDADTKEDGTVFWGLTGSYGGNYGAPGGYCFDINCGNRKSLIDQNQTMVLKYVNNFLESLRHQSDRTQGDHIMLTMGSDFQYQRAAINYANLDLLIGTIMHAAARTNTNNPERTEIDIPSIFGPHYDTINIFYSSPEYYTHCKYEEQQAQKQQKQAHGEERGKTATIAMAMKDSRLRDNNSTTNTASTTTTTKSRIKNSSLRPTTSTAAAVAAAALHMKTKTTQRNSSGRSSSSSIDWSIKRDDFFPYSDFTNSFWSGYYTSRPSLKKFERIGSSFLLASRQILSSSRAGKWGWGRAGVSVSTNNNNEIAAENANAVNHAALYQLEDAMGVLQHHDGVSGTSKQHVAYDYAKMLQIGIDGVVPLLVQVLKQQFLGTTSRNNTHEGRPSYLNDLTYCQLLNETKCSISTNATTIDDTAGGNDDDDGVDLYVIVYNSLASVRSTMIDLPVGIGGKFLVQSVLSDTTSTTTSDHNDDNNSNNYIPDNKGGIVNKDAFDNDGNTLVSTMIEARLQPLRLHSSSPASNVLSFMAKDIPPVGAKLFRIKKQQQTSDDSSNGGTHIIKEHHHDVDDSSLPLVVSALPARELSLHDTDDNNNNEDQEKENDQQTYSDDDTIRDNNGIDNKGDTLKEIFNGRFSVVVDTVTGLIHRIGKQNYMKQGYNFSTWGYYTSFDSNRDSITSDTSNQNSGAYIFRPSTPNQKLHLLSVTNTTVVDDDDSIEIHITYEESWIATITRVRKNVPFIEIEYQVGPIPIDDGRGKEIVTKYNTMVDNDATFYTDSNGRKFMERKRNYRPTWDLTVYEPIAGNYYPVNTAIYVENSCNNKEQDKEEGEEAEGDNEKRGRGQTLTKASAFAVVVDRSQGGGSISDGTIELMVHRRTPMDDSRGVGEPINETDIGITACRPYGNATRIGNGIVVRGKHRIIVDDNSNSGSGCFDGGIGGARLARSIMDASFAEPLVFVGTAPSKAHVPLRSTSYSDLIKPLPDNIMLITKRQLLSENNKHEKEPGLTTAESFLVRLGHQYDKGEDPALSLPVDINLSVLFPGQSITSVEEKTLSGNKNIHAWNKERYNWTSSIKTISTKEKRTSFYHDNGTDEEKNDGHFVTLTPMDIRTFIVSVEIAYL